EAVLGDIVKQHLVCGVHLADLFGMCAVSRVGVVQLNQFPVAVLDLLQSGALAESKYFQCMVQFLVSHGASRSSSVSSACGKSRAASRSASQRSLPCAGLISRAGSSFGSPLPCSTRR